MAKEKTTRWSRPLDWDAVRLGKSEDGYVYFFDLQYGVVDTDHILWIMNEGGWIALMNGNEDDVLFETYQNSIPDSDTIEAVRRDAEEMLRQRAGG